MQQEYSSSKGAVASLAITGQVIDNAMAIVICAEVGQSQSLRRWAWAALKSARGQTISQTGLNRLSGRGTPRKGRTA